MKNFQQIDRNRFTICQLHSVNAEFIIMNRNWIDNEQSNYLRFVEKGGYVWVKKDDLGDWSHIVVGVVANDLEKAYQEYLKRNKSK